MPILDANVLEFISRSPDQTRRVGMHLGAALASGDLICLEGELGSGKTTFVQGIAAGWGSLDPVSSPTFVIVNLYRREDQQQLAHLDAYRIEHASEAAALDLDALLERGPLVVEWAERIAEALPNDRLWVELQHVDEEQRGMQFKAGGERYEHLLAGFQQAVFGVA
jgi:tRNA threonylcarbamoyladenosine biosynthesis protein TsaE